ncbi:MAG: hypothetical protein QG567_1174 [Campylobacterota bacterium]|nr:hypothetical protein [Campylobacterota bacterium]
MDKQFLKYCDETLKDLEFNKKMGMVIFDIDPVIKAFKKTVKDASLNKKSAEIMYEYVNSKRLSEEELLKQAEGAAEVSGRAAKDHYENQLQIQNEHEYMKNHILKIFPELEEKQD